MQGTWCAPLPFIGRQGLEGNIFVSRIIHGYGFTIPSGRCRYWSGFYFWRVTLCRESVPIHFASARADRANPITMIFFAFGDTLPMNTYLISDFWGELF